MRLLIAHSSEFFCKSLAEKLEMDFDIHTCCDGISAANMLQSLRPDALIIDFMLPCKDGLTVLQEASYIPTAVLALTTYTTPYIEQAAARAGVGYVMLMPTIQAVVSRLDDMLYCLSHAPTPQELRLVAAHMQKLGFSSNLDGYKQLRVGIPMYRRNPRQTVSKDLYPSIARIYDWHDPRTVEHSMRSAIQNAWRRRDNDIWSAYFPPNDNGDIPCPSNKEFICRLAELLEMA